MIPFDQSLKSYYIIEGNRKSLSDNKANLSVVDLTSLTD